MSSESDKAAEVVRRKLAGLPLTADDPIRNAATNEKCVDCGGPVAEKGSLAQQHGLCGDCSSWRQRTGKWKTQPLP